MLKLTYSFDELKMSSKLVRDLIQEDSLTSEFVDDYFSFDNIKNQVEKNRFTSEKRTVLVKQLIVQNESLALSAKSKDNLKALEFENSYTITTGHQLNLMTGPLYSIYKVVQVVQITERLKKENPESHFVPVFWMATEDHDFEEINHINLFGNKIEWVKDGQLDSIAGRITTDSINSFLDPIREKFQNPESVTIVTKFLSFYSATKNLQEATRALMNELFADYGILIIDGDDRELKKLFVPIVQKEIKEQFVFKSVSHTNEALAAKNYHQQVYVRGCNLFFIDENNRRHRIKEDGGSFAVAENKLSKQELVALLSDKPESFSPNALMRPLYQEAILPNLAYVGGGGEIAYWLQLKSTFEAAELTFPMLKVRDSVLLVQQNQLDVLNELNLDLLDLKLGVDQIIKDIALKEAGDDLDISPIVNQIENAKNDLLNQAASIGKGMDGMIKAEFSKFSKSLDKIAAKMVKAEKGKFEKVQKQVQRIANSFFPNGGFQERYENALPYLVKDTDFVNKIMANFTAENTTQIRLIKL